MNGNGIEIKDVGCLMKTSELFPPCEMPDPIPEMIRTIEMLHEERGLSVEHRDALIRLANAGLIGEVGGEFMPGMKRPEIRITIHRDLFFS